MKTLEIVSRSSDETMEIGKKLGKAAARGDVFALTGDLGAGKTHLSKGIAAGLGVDKTVNSPTFTILKVYEGHVPFYHIDAYRLDAEGEEDLGLGEYIEGDGVSVIEWAAAMSDRLPKKRIDIDMERISDEERLLKFSFQDYDYKKISKELAKQ